MAVPLLEAKLESELYVAVIVWFPALSAAVAKEALPPLSGTWVSTLAPSAKVIMPVGTPVPETEGTTVAVNVTDWPCTDEFGETLSVVIDALA